MPKLKGAPRSDLIQKRLKKKSPWYTSILDPLHGADCKIPDETGVETGTLQVVQRGEVTVNSNGITGMRILTPYVNILKSGSEGVNIQLVTSTATGSTINWGDGTNNGNNRGFEWNGSAEFKTITNAHRVVSAAIYIQPEPSLANNEGELVLWTSEFSREDSVLYVDYMNRYKSIVVPINNNQASVVRWYPIAREDLSFKNFINTDGNTLSDVMASDTDVPAWGLGFLVSGAHPGTVIRYTCVVNFEFIPKFNTLNVLGASPSPQDVTESELVENWVQDMPIAQPISQRTAASSPEAVSPRHEDDQTGFGMFFSVFQELLPIALAFA